MNMKRIIVLCMAAVLLCLPMIALAEGEDIIDIEITPTPEATTEAEATPTPEATTEAETTPTPEVVTEAEATPTPSPTPYYYAYDTDTIIGGLASFLGVQQAEDTPQNLGEAIPYLLRICITVGVLWFIYAMIRGFTGNIFGKARSGVNK